MIRRYERFVFHGVPERPEPVFERDDNSYVAERATGRAVHSETESSSDDSTLIGYIRINLEKGTEEFIRVETNE